MKSAQGNEEAASTQQLLKKAYVLLGDGHFQEALNYCERAAGAGEDEHLAHTLRGAILTASGRPLEAMRALIRLHRGRPQEVLTALYLAEACFFAGRHRRGWKVLEKIDDGRLADSPWSGFAAQLRETWNGLAEWEEVPKPQPVALDTSEAASETDHTR